MSVNLKSFHLADEFTDPETERGLIAALTADPELYWRLVDLLPREAFLYEIEAFDKLIAAVENDQAPGPCGWTPALDPEAAARRLGDLYQRRLLAAAWERMIAPALYDPERSAGEVVSLLEMEAAEIQTAVREYAAGQAQALPALFAGILAMLNEHREAFKAHGKVVVGIPTGIPKLDDLLGGLQPGLHLLAAEPGAGKTTLACQVGSHAARQGYPVIFVTFEETPERLTLKVICGLAGLNQKLYVEGRAEPERVAQAIKDYGADLQAFKIMEGTARLTVAMVKAKALAAMRSRMLSKVIATPPKAQSFGSVLWPQEKRDF